MNPSKSEIFVVCYPYVEPYLKKEIINLGYEEAEIEKKGVKLTGNFGDAQKLNLHLRTATKVLFKIAEFKCENGDDLYMNAVKLDWTKIMNPDSYFSVDSYVRNNTIKDNRYANLRLKDAIVDCFNLKYDRRPDTGPEKDKLVIFIHWKDDTCQIYLDTSGQTISKRGYRSGYHPAPMNESLAAAVIIASGWDRRSSFINPMCGSGTLAIEAAMMHLNKAPGLLRQNYSFMHCNWYQPSYWRNIRNEALSSVHKESRISIVATDHSHDAVKGARQNAKDAGVAKFINFKVCDFSETEIPEKKGNVIINPEYGQRMGDVKDLMPVYRSIGSFLKKSCKGFKGGVFSGNWELINEIPLKPIKKIRMLNGKIECRLALYELY